MALSTALLQKRMEKFVREVTIYPVSCERLAKCRTDVQWLEGVLSGGAMIVQLRDKETSDRELYEKAVVFRRKTLEAEALFIVNNRVDIALLTGADGVHLGNTDLPASEVRKIGPDLIIGVSANTEEQAVSAEERGASYFNIGPIFPTQTKKELTELLGPEAISLFSSRSSLPFTVMGGIKRHHIPDLIKSGARRIAVVTALTQADDIAQETREWINAIGRF